MYLLDTNVVSELRKVQAKRAHPNVMAWLNTIVPDTLYLSVIVIQEIEIGVRLAEYHKSPESGVLRQWLDNYVVIAFAGRILSVDMDVVRKSAALHVPLTRPGNDTLIAATALVHGLTIVTRNIGDFVSTGVPVLHPWKNI